MTTPGGSSAGHRVRWRCVGQRLGCWPPKPSSAGSRVTGSCRNWWPHSKEQLRTSLVCSTYPKLSQPECTMQSHGGQPKSTPAGHRLKTRQSASRVPSASYCVPDAPAAKRVPRPPLYRGTRDAVAARGTQPRLGTRFLSAPVIPHRGGCGMEEGTSARTRLDRPYLQGRGDVDQT